MLQLRHAAPPHPSSPLHALAEIGHPGADSSARAIERRKEKRTREMLLKRAQLVAVTRGCLSVCLPVCPSIYLSRLSCERESGGWTPTSSPLLLLRSRCSDGGRFLSQNARRVSSQRSSHSCHSQTREKGGKKKEERKHTRWEALYYGNDRCVHLLTQRHMHTHGFLDAVLDRRVTTPAIYSISRTGHYFPQTLRRFTAQINTDAGK